MSFPFRKEQRMILACRHWLRWLQLRWRRCAGGRQRHLLDGLRFLLRADAARLYKSNRPGTNRTEQRTKEPHSPGHKFSPRSVSCSIPVSFIHSASEELLRPSCFFFGSNSPNWTESCRHHRLKSRQRRRKWIASYWSSWPPFYTVRTIPPPLPLGWITASAVWRRRIRRKRFNRFVLCPMWVLNLDSWKNLQRRKTAINDSPSTWIRSTSTDSSPDPAVSLDFFFLIFKQSETCHEISSK